MSIGLWSYRRAFTLSYDANKELPPQPDLNNGRIPACAHSAQFF